jgi:hypothetical protein
MQFLEHPGEGKRIHFSKKQEVDSMRLGCYSKDDCDLRFEYKRGGETRGIWLELTRDEAKELLQFLERFLNDPWED